MIENEQQLHGRRLRPQTEIHFRCGPDLSCFNRCCRHKRLPLYPYDVLRMRIGTGLLSQELLQRHVELEIDPQSGWPELRIGLHEDGSCPFVGPRGCQIYSHRPTCCRIFPLTRAVAPKEHSSPDEIFLAQEHEGCRGWSDDRRLTVADYIEEQGLEPFHRANNRLLPLLLHARRQQVLPLSQYNSHAFIMGLYNLDVFRQAVLQPGFSQRYGLSDALLRRAQKEDEALLELGQRWLHAVLFGEPAQ